jgi:hypothetical protein
MLNFKKLKKFATPKYTLSSCVKSISNKVCDSLVPANVP